MHVLNLFKKTIIRFPWILVILFTIPSFIALLRPGFFPMQDDLQVFRLHQMDKCIKDLQIPCRWIPDMGYQYGYPQFNFYNPSVFYLGEVFHLAGFQFIDSVKILFILGLVLSAISMFLLLRSFVDNFPALVGSLLYTYAPFKAAQAYVRGSLNELWSFVFFPLIFLFAYQLIKTNKSKYIIYLASSVGLMLLTHNLMSVVIAPLAAVWILNWLVLEKGWRVLPKLFVSLLLGLGLSAFFVLPVIFEGKYVHLETLIGGYFDYRQHFVNIYQLFLSNYFGYGSSVFGNNDEVSLSVGIVQWISAAITLTLALINFKKKKKLSITVIIVFLLSVFTIFLMHQRSSFIWERLEFFKYFQFPWRFLAGSTFLLSILGAMGISFITNKRLSVIYGGLITVSLGILYLSFFKPVSWNNVSDQDKFSGQSWEKQLTISIFDYLPIYAKLPPNKKAPERPEVLEGDVKVISYFKGSNYQEGEVEVVGNEAVIRVPLFDFPGMKVTSNNKQIPHWHNDCRFEEYCLGLITFKLPEGNHKIKAELGDTLIRTIGNTISLFSFLTIISFLTKRVYEKTTN